MLSDILFWTVDQHAVIIQLINSVGGCDDHRNFWRTRNTCPTVRSFVDSFLRCGQSLFVAQLSDLTSCFVLLKLFIHLAKKGRSHLFGGDMICIFQQEEEEQEQQ